MLGLLGQRWALRGEAQALTGPPAPRLPEAVGRRPGGRGSARPRLHAGQEAVTRGGRRGRAGSVCVPHAFSRDEPEFFLHEAPGGRGCGLRGSSRPCAVVDWVVRSPWPAWPPWACRGASAPAVSPRAAGPAPAAPGHVRPGRARRFPADAGKFKGVQGAWERGWGGGWGCRHTAWGSGHTHGNTPPVPSSAG